MDVKHGEPHVREDLRMWRKRALKLEAEVARLRERDTEFQRRMRAVDDENERLQDGAALVLLKAAKCPDPNCDGEGMCCGEVPGYDGEPDLDCWQCQWCAERKALLGETE